MGKLIPLHKDSVNNGGSGNGNGKTTPSKRRKKSDKGRYGEGSVFKRKGSNNWYIAYRVAGRQKTISSGTTDEDIARAMLAEKRLEIAKAEPGVPASELGITFSETALGWLATKLRADISRTTKYQWEEIVYNHLLPAFGGFVLTDISVDDVEEYLKRKRLGEKLRVADGIEESRKYARETVVKHHQALRGIFQFAIREEFWSKGNPVEQIRVPNARRIHGKQRILSDKEFKRLHAAATSDLEKTVYTLLINLGLRIGEALALVENDYNRRTRKLSVSRTLKKLPKLPSEAKGTKRKEPFHSLAEDGEQSTKTTHSARVLQLSEGLGDLVEEWLDSDEREERVEKIPSGEPELVFPSQVGTPMSPNNFRRRQWKKAISAAKLDKDLTPHSLRHTFASAQIHSGRDAVFVAYLLGHSSPDTTLRIYAHMFKERENEIADIGIYSKTDTEGDKVLTPKSPSAKEVILGQKPQRNSSDHKRTS